MLLLILPLGVIAQDKTLIFTLKSDIKKGDALFKHQSYIKALDYYKRVSERESGNSYVKLQIAECYRLLNNTQEAEEWYRPVMKSSSINSIHKLHFAEVLLSNGKPDSASYWYEQYALENKEDKRTLKKRKQLAELHRLFRDSLAYSVFPVSFNSPESDFSPVYFNKGIVFLSSRKQNMAVKTLNATDNSHFLDLYYAEPLTDTSFTEPVKFHSDINSNLHEGPITFFDKGKKAIFSQNVSSGTAGQYKRLYLYSAELSEDQKDWKNIQPLPFNNHAYSVSHPTFDKNQNILYFVSDKPGGYGGTDIYRSFYNNGSWSMPENLGNEINTEGNEMFPFIASDTVLYFSSTGHGGLGGLDIFSVDLKESNLMVQNLGYPVNSPKDDFGIVLDNKNSKGYFSSNRLSGGANDDIFALTINKIKVEGIVMDMLKSGVVKGATVNLVNAETGIKEQILSSNQKGLFSLHVIPGRKYYLDVVKDGFKVARNEIYSLDPQQKVLRSKFQLEKYNKTYIKGRVMYYGVHAGISRIQIFDPTTDSVDVVYTNRFGEFQCEINSDTVSVLIADSAGFSGIFKFQPVKRKRKASSLQFIEIELGTLDSVAVNGVFKNSSTSKPSEGTKLILLNELTGKEEQVQFSTEGDFNLRLWNKGKYSIIKEYQDARVNLSTFIPSETKFLELIDQ